LIRPVAEDNPAPVAVCIRVRTDRKNRDAVTETSFDLFLCCHLDRWRLPLVSQTPGIAAEDAAFPARHNWALSLPDINRPTAVETRFVGQAIADFLRIFQICCNDTFEALPGLCYFLVAISEIDFLRRISESSRFSEPTKSDV
jgi:hypothetical protein